MRSGTDPEAVVYWYLEALMWMNAYADVSILFRGGRFFIGKNGTVVTLSSQDANF